MEPPTRVVLGLSAAAMALVCWLTAGYTVEVASLPKGMYLVHARA